VPRRSGKSEEVKAGLPQEVDTRLTHVAADIKAAIGKGKATKHDISAWMIHWFLTLGFKEQLRIAEVGKAIEQSLVPSRTPKGNPEPVASKAPSRPAGTTSTKVWTNRIKKPRHDGADGFNGHGETAREMSESPVKK
jgi:hypothetical protein